MILAMTPSIIYLKTDAKYLALETKQIFHELFVTDCYLHEVDKEVTGDFRLHNILSQRSNCI